MNAHGCHFLDPHAAMVVIINPSRFLPRDYPPWGKEQDPREVHTSGFRQLLVGFLDSLPYIFLNHPHHDLHVLPADVHFDDAKLGPGQCCFSTITDLWRSILASLSKAKLEIQ